MEAIDKIRRAKIQIQSENPFFAYLSLYLKFREAKKGELPEYAGMGVNARGDCIYNKEFVDNLSDKELMGVITHEILHLCFLHLLRLGNRNMEKWNISADIIVNFILKQNSFELPKGGLETDYDNPIMIFGQKIEDVDKKTPEQIYDELKFKVKKNKIICVGKGKEGEGKGEGKGFDYHDYSANEKSNKDKDKKGKDNKESGLSEDERRELEKEWKERLTEAYTCSKIAGKIPAGIERLLGDIHKSEINWRSILLREVQNTIPWNFTYAKPFKSSFSTGYFMPDIEKEMIDIVVGVDVSGSIGKEEYTDFVSEIIGMARAFRGRINIRFLTHDVEIKNDYVVENGNIEKIKKLKIDGGGGTSHKQILNYISEKIRGAKLAIFLTDGYSDLEDIDLNKFRFKKIFVIQQNGKEDCIKDKTTNKVLRLKGKY